MRLLRINRWSVGLFPCKYAFKRQNYCRIMPSPLQHLKVSTGVSPRCLWTSNPRNNNANKSDDASVSFKSEKPSYQLTFTCKVCSTRSSHNVSKQAYHHGTVLIQCPQCKNRHLIADHLKIFSDKRITLEDILAEKNQTITKRTIEPTVGGDLEWEQIPAEIQEKLMLASKPKS